MSQFRQNADLRGLIIDRSHRLDALLNIVAAVLCGIAIGVMLAARG